MSPVRDRSFERWGCAALILAGACFFICCVCRGDEALDALQAIQASADAINAKADQCVFLLTACAYTLGALLGYASWFLVLRAMGEADF